jgi:hypothetical protein
MEKQEEEQEEEEEVEVGQDRTYLEQQLGY